jgi:hypothetical protein
LFMCILPKGSVPSGTVWMYDRQITINRVPAAHSRYPAITRMNRF